MDARLVVSRMLGLEEGDAHVIRNQVNIYGFNDIATNVREHILKLKSHPWAPKEVPIRGFIFDVKTRKLNEVTA